MIEDEALPLRIGLLGPFDVRIHEHPLPHLRSQKGQWLLALLVLRQGHAVAREWLADTLWPDSLREEAFRSLRQSLFDLRKALGDQEGRLYSPTWQALGLDLAGAEADVLAFDAAVRRGDAASLERGIGLYRGPLLEGCSEPWVLQEREARQQAYCKALQTLAAHAQAGGDAARAVGYLRQWAAAEPWAEEGRRALMIALAKHGEMNAALQVYQEWSHWLHDHDPRRAPAGETSALYQALRAEARRLASARATTAPPHRSFSSGSIPRPLAGLVGRAAEVRHVHAQLRLARLVTLTGPGGVGKTRLAVAVAEEIGDEYPDGVWFVELAAVSDPERVPRAVTTTLGMSEEPGVPLDRVLRQNLAGKRLLLVLDNSEHLVKACAQLAADLLQSCPELRVLVTSRQTLGLPGETVWRLPPLPVPDLELLPVEKAALPRVIMAYEAVELFVRRAEAAQPAFRLTSENALAVMRVCRQLDGIPLALELAALCVRALPVEQMAARLDDCFRLLREGSGTGLPHHQTLRVLIDWSYDPLPEAERALLGRLSVFASGWTLAAAEAICSDFDPPMNTDEHRSPVDITEVLHLLTELVDRSLVIYEDRNGQARYRLLETVGQYARARLTERGESDTSHARHGAYFLSLAEEARAKLSGPEQARWLNTLEMEHDNLRAALVSCHCEPGGSEVGLRLAAALGRFWRVRGYLSEGRARLAEALSSADAPRPTAARAQALYEAASLAWRQGDFAAMGALFEQSLAIYRNLADRQGVAAVLNGLAFRYSAGGDYAAARALLEQSLTIYRHLVDEQGMADALYHLGRVAHVQGDTAAAWAFYERALPLRRELGDGERVAHTLVNFGALAGKRGNDRQADSCIAECLNISRSLGEKFFTARALEEMAALARDRGHAERAAQLYGGADALRERLGSPRPPRERAAVARALAGLRARLGEGRFTGIVAAGRALRWEQAIEYALHGVEEG